jgi:hypothetical protein
MVLLAMLVILAFANYYNSEDSYIDVDYIVMLLQVFGTYCHYILMVVVRWVRVDQLKLERNSPE